MSGGDERGSGTVLLLGVVAAILVVGSVLGLLAGAQAARGQAQAAADLAALAGATAWRYGTGEPCDVAAQTAERNAAGLASCSGVAGGVVAVVATRAAPAGVATAHARAGPRP